MHSAGFMAKQNSQVKIFSCKNGIDISFTRFCRGKNRYIGMGLKPSILDIYALVNVKPNEMRIKEQRTMHFP